MVRALLHKLIHRLSTTGERLWPAGPFGRPSEEYSCPPLVRGRRAFRPVVESLEVRLTPAVTFAGQQTFSVGNFNPEDVAVGDFNGDGRPDLAEVSFNLNVVTVLLNTTAAGASTPTFTTPYTFAVGTDPVAVVVADFNGDGRPDLAVLNNAGTVSVLLNTTAAGSSTPTFTTQVTFAVGANPRGMAVGDFNGDGRPDLAVANFNDNTVSVLLNTTAAGSSTPTFTTQVTFATGDNPHSVAVGDFNGDGRPDLAFTNSNDNTVGVLLDTTPDGAATPTFAAQQTFTVGRGDLFLAAADFNGDGRPDLAVTNNDDNTVSVLLDTTAAGASGAAFAAQQTFAVGTNPNSADGVAVGDFNGDGRPDLAVTDFADKAVSVFVNTTASGAATASFAAQQSFAVGNDPFTAAVADFNGDGRADLAVANQGDGTVSVLLDTTTPFPSAIPVIVGEFGSQGVWEFNRSLNTWVQLTPANASRLAADPVGDVVGEFPGYGIWEYKPVSGWKQINTGDATLLAMDHAGDVAAAFPGRGVWEFRPASGWQQIGTSDASALAMDAQGDVVGTFPPYGVWLYRPASGFKQIGGGNASVLAMDAYGDVVGAFPGYGVWEYRPATGFKQIDTRDASALAVDAYGDVAAEFNGMGYSEYHPASGWSPILPVNATRLGMDAYGDVFGALLGLGVWEYDPYRGWFQLAASDASVLVVA